MANDDIILSEAQVAALEKKKHDDEACGEIETAHPGYLGSQDIFNEFHQKPIKYKKSLYPLIHRPTQILILAAKRSAHNQPNSA